MVAEEAPLAKEGRQKKQRGAIVTIRASSGAGCEIALKTFRDCLPAIDLAPKGSTKLRARMFRGGAMGEGDFQREGLLATPHCCTGEIKYKQNGYLLSDPPRVSSAALQQRGAARGSP